MAQDKVPGGEALIFARSEIGHIIERHIGDRALSGRQGENILSEIWQTISTGAPYYGVPPILIYLAAAVLITLIIAYSVAGKGRGSHAGREEIRRAYRRKLAQEMAKEDAAKIRRGEKPRRRWMQW